VNGNCADGVCCNTPCGACKSCNQAGKVGLCSNVPLGQDPHDYCSLSSCQAACNGTGGCTTAPAGICNSSGCANGPSDGFGRPISPLATIALCSGATQSCPAPSGGAQSCNLHTCDGPQCNLTCLDNSDCISGTVCLSGKCEYCASSADCYPGAPSCDVGPSGAVCACPGDPGCADAICNSPGDCMAAGFGSVCAQYWDVCQCSTAVGDVCNGRGPRCGGAPGFCTCGAAPDNRCLVGQLCTNNTLGGVCKIAPGFPCTGLPSDCASGACAAGLCTRLPSGRPCAHGSECTSDWCDTTWKCF
jgi:hypothetical protein